MSAYLCKKIMEDDKVKLSVLMSVYEKEDPIYFSDSLRSLSSQTRMADNVVIVEDGRINDELSDIINAYRAKLNITSVKLKLNRGLAEALNEGLKYCDSEYVARMDSDDISHKTRFERQIEFMEKNNDVSVCGAYIEEITGAGRKISVRTVPLTHNEICRFAKTRSPMSHPVVMFRKNDVLNVGGYRLFRKSQDMALWSLMIMRGYRFANIGEPLLKMRICGDIKKKRGLSYYKEEVKVLKYQKDIGFINTQTYLKNVLVRRMLRMSPDFIINILYRFRDLYK